MRIHLGWRSVQHRVLLSPADRTIAVRGRWSDWELPPESFGDDLGILDGLAVPAMSATGMLAMKQQFPALRNGRPWREKDRADIEALRALIIQGAESPEESY
jgi:lincosamide nucleotidyltransferase A/C/D/E